jgi:hypothetical protein
MPAPMKKPGSVPVHRMDFHAEFENARLVLPLCEAALTDNSLTHKAFHPLGSFWRKWASWRFVSSLKTTRGCKLRLRWDNLALLAHEKTRHAARPGSYTLSR